MYSNLDPRKVNIQTTTLTVSNLIQKIQNGMIVLHPDYQRKVGLWSDIEQSRLIESIIIRIPIPTFYFDADENDVLAVVDGLQRLFSLDRFMGISQDDPDRLRLTGLEYLSDFEGLTFEELPVNIQMRISETNLIAHIIRPGTPENIRISIFTRINTIGLQFTAAEIRNSVYRGRAAEMLRRMAASDEFRTAVRGSVSSDRMLDCEFANRFLAFYMMPLSDYHDNLEEFLDTALYNIKYYAGDDDIDDYEKAYKRSLDLSNRLFGDKAFRKIRSNGNYGKINIALFDCVTVNLAKLSYPMNHILIAKKDIFLRKYTELFNDENFLRSITSSTAKRSSIETRFGKFRDIILETLND